MRKDAVNTPQIIIVSLALGNSLMAFQKLLKFKFSIGFSNGISE